ncbi:DUF2637 domain-containing protein [Streptomyces xanthophaeus]
MRTRFARLRAELDPILLQAVIAAALSFAHLHDVAEAAGQTGWKAWAYPISVDLLMVESWRRTKRPGGRALGWFWFAVALTASVAANVVTAGVMDLTNPPVLLRILVAGWPAVAFLGGALLFHARTRGVEPQEVPEDPQLPAVEPAADEVEEEVTAPLEAPERPLLRTYAEVAEVLGVAVPTVRGWAASGHIQRHRGDSPGAVRVDLKECTKYQRMQRVGV